MSKNKIFVTIIVFTLLGTLLPYNSLNAANGKDKNNTERTTTEEDNDSNKVTVEKSQYVEIYYEEEGATSDTTYTPKNEKTTENWLPETSVNPVYSADSMNLIIPDSTEEPNVSSPSSGKINNSTTETAKSEKETVEEDKGDFSDDKLTLSINGEDVSSLEYEGDEIITDIEISGLTDCELVYFNAEGKKAASNSISSASALEAIQINSSDDISYCVKTKQLGWLAPVSSETMTGTIGTDDYIIGLKLINGELSTESDAVSDNSIYLAGLSREFAEALEFNCNYVIHTDNGWGEPICNAGINGEGEYVNAIRINAGNEITYRVYQEKWLPEVSNWVLAGNPFIDTAISGIVINGDVMYRVKDSDGEWSEWVSGGTELKLTKGYITDIQILE